MFVIQIFKKLYPINVFVKYNFVGVIVFVSLNCYTLNVSKICAMILSITTFSITTFSIMTYTIVLLRVVNVSVTSMPFLLKDVTLNAVKLYAVKLNALVLSVVVPKKLAVSLKTASYSKNLDCL
jgi:hypothetical protein